MEIWRKKKSISVLLPVFFLLCGISANAAVLSADKYADDPSGDITTDVVVDNGSEADDGIPGETDSVADDYTQADDEPALKAPSPGVAGNYVWQTVESGDLGKFDGVSWFAGYQFASLTGGYVTELCGFFLPVEMKVDLFDSEFQLLSSAAIKGGGNWNCSPISPVAIESNQDYYVVAETDSGRSAYYEFKCCNPSLLPAASGGVSIKAGVRQSSKNSFGTKVNRYNYLIFGLVDIKFSPVSPAVQPLSGERPVISDPQPSGTISNNQPLMSVATDVNATCRYDATKKNYADLTKKFSSTGKKLHTVRLGTLSDGTYSYYVRCKDAEGYKSLATKISFTVKNGSSSNINAPVISDPQPSGTITEDSPTISVATDENATCKYATTDGSYSSMSETFDTTGKKAHKAAARPLNSGDYIYYVRCKDAAGNVNIESKKIEFSVESDEGDTTPPTISNVSASPSSGDIGDTFTLTAKVTDNNSVASVKARMQKPDGTTISIITLKDDGKHADGAANDDVYGRKWITTGKGEGKYYMDVVATDTYANSIKKNNGATLTLADSSAGDDDDDDDSDVDSSCISLLKNGSTANKMDVVILPCNYGSDMTTFASEAQAAVDSFFSYSPISTNKNLFNVYLVKKTGFTCGTDLCNDLDASNVSDFKSLAAKCGADETIILTQSNDQNYSGCANPDNHVAFVKSDTPEAMVHESGHALFGLSDEYTYSDYGFDSSYWCGSNDVGDMTNSPNCSNSGCSKWSGISGAGCVKGCTCAGNYRATQNCVMYNVWSTSSFCPVCTKYLVDFFKNYK